MRLALARVNYSQLYGVYDGGKTYEQRDILIPYHLLVIANAAKKFGAQVKIFDGEVNLLTEEELANEILNWNPDFVGLTATTPDIVQTLKVCELIKKVDGVIETIIGGTHATALPESIPLDYVDYVVKGYGEEVILDILKGKSEIGVIEKVSKCEAGLPDYSLLDFSDYMFTDPLRGRVKSASIISLLGCPFECSFCFHSRDLRYKKVEDFVKEVDYLYNVKGVRYFYIYDDTFLLNKERALSIMTGLLKFKEAHFQCYARASMIDEAIVENLKRINVVRVSMGAESGSSEILKSVNKGVALESVRKACSILKKFNIESRASFILGFPYETHKTINETIEFAKSLDLYHANFNIMTPYPGTKIYEMALKDEGIHFIKEEYRTKWDEYRRWGKAIVRTEEVSGEELEEYQIQAQVKFYARDEILSYYKGLFEKGNGSRYFYRPLNFAWNRKFGKDVPFWDKLEESSLVGQCVLK